MDLKQWIAIDPSGTDLLVTMYEDGEIELAPRLDETRWGQPLPVQPVTA